MQSGIRAVSAATLAAVLLLGEPGSAAADESASRDMSYFCVAGNVGDFRTLYITTAHHVDRMKDLVDGSSRSIDAAWEQAVRGLPYPFNAHCFHEQTAQIQNLRQTVLAEPHEKTVNVAWYYGKAGPATISGVFSGRGESD